MNINVNYHSSIRIEDIYVDPFNVKEGSAKYIFITHSHYDHYSFDDIKRIVNEATVFVCTKDVYEDLKNKVNNEILVVEPNKNYCLDNLEFKTIASYNMSKKFHPKDNGWVGYIIEVNNLKYAILGDSDLTEDVKNVKCDVLFVPIGGTYTMNAREASELTNIINPKLVVPVHYNGIVGSKKDEEDFLSGLNKEIECKIYL